MMSTNEDFFAAITNSSDTLFPLAKASVVYRPSLAYVLQQLKSFLDAIQPLQKKELNQSELQALQRLNGLLTHFGSVLPHLGKKWLSAMLNWSSIHMHNYIDGFRKTLIDICTQLSLDPVKVIKFDDTQDKVNKIADLEHLKKLLREVRETSISCTNSVDVQQLIEVRLNSIISHLPPKGVDPVTGIMAQPSVEMMTDIKQKMDKELAIFNEIDIPCDDLKLDEALGSGGFGTVFCAIRLSTAELLAVKEVRSDKLTMSTWASLYSEVATMAPLRHRFVLELVGAHIKEPYRIITRFCPGKSLFDRLHRGQMRQLSPEKLTAIAYQVAEGMRFLHKNGIVHRDLKTMNILLDDTDTAKIADFGLAGMMKDNKDLCGGVGTPHYTAPEVLEHKRYGPSVDTYSYGIILWEMAMQQIPYRDKTHQEILDQVVNKHWKLPINNNVPENLKKLITRCCSHTPNERPEFSEIVKMFEKGEIMFLGCEEISPTSLNPVKSCPPLDITYLIDTLKTPANKQFPSVVRFLVDRIDEKMKNLLIDKKLINYYSPDSDNIASILLLESELLHENEFADFLASMGNQMIDKVMESKNSSIASVVRFCIKIPTKELGLISKIIPKIMHKIKDPEIGAYAVILLARLEPTAVEPFIDKLISFFTHSGLDNIKDQNELDAIAVLLPQMAEKIAPRKFEKFTKILELDFNIPISIINLLIEKTTKSNHVRLALSVLKAGFRTDVTEPLITIISQCEKNELEQLSRHFEMYDIIQKFLEDRKLIKASLFLIFQISKVEDVHPVLANHPLLQSVLQLDGFVAQRLQIFTSFLSSEQFCIDTTISEIVIKLLITALNEKTPTLINYSLKLIGALTSHSSGCALISETGMLSLFSQMFLSSTSIDNHTALTILANAAKGSAEIPQISLIISCLMQDLTYSVANRSVLLRTLAFLISNAPQSVQDHDIQNNILPLLTIRQEPVIVILVIQLLIVCDISSYKRFYTVIAQKLFNILSTPTFLFPELLGCAADLVAILTLQFDMKMFLTNTKMKEFFEHAMTQIEESENLREIAMKLRNAAIIIQNIESNAVNPSVFHEQL